MNTPKHWPISMRNIDVSYWMRENTCGLCGSSTIMILLSEDGCLSQSMWLKVSVEQVSGVATMYAKMHMRTTSGVLP